MTGWPRVVAWWAVLSALALLCLWSAADRLAGQGVLLKLPTPLLTGGQALLARVTLAAKRGDRADAVALSRAALRRRPIDARSLRVAGLAAIAAGDLQRGDTLMRAAGAAGWRDVPTQLYWAQAALSAGDGEVAAERLDALIRGGVSAARTRALGRALEASAAGRAALVRRWAEPDSWAAAYLADVAGLAPTDLDHRLQTIDAARAAGIVRDRSTAAGIAWALVERGRPDLAYRVAGQAPGRVLASFEASGETRPGPFAWSFTPAAGLDTAVERHGGGMALHVVASGSTLLPIASQLVRLPPGPARLDAAVEGARTDLPVIATLTCSDGTSATAEPLPTTTGHIAERLTVARGCGFQRLTLSVAGEETRRGADLWLSAVTITPAATAAP